MIISKQALHERFRRQTERQAREKIMSNLSLRFTDAFSGNIRKAAQASAAITLLAGLAGALLIGIYNSGVAGSVVAFFASASLAALLLLLADPFALARMLHLKRQAAARIDVTDERLLVELRDGSTLRFNRNSCCGKFSFEPNSRMHGYYLNIHRADGSEVSIYTSARTSERDALRKALHGLGAQPYESPCGAHPACPSCRGDKPLVA